MTKRMTAEEMSAAKSTLTPEGYRKIGRVFYQWCRHNEDWFPLNATRVRMLMWDRHLEALREAARTKGWQEFDGHYEAQKTAKDGAKDYSVHGPGNARQLCYMGSPMFASMTASTLYSWMERTVPLLRLSREADAFRIDTLMPRKVAV